MKLNMLELRILAERLFEAVTGDPYRTMPINDGRRAGGFDLVGHDYRSRRSNASLAAPSAR